MRGKWALELKEIQKIRNKINLFKTDVAALRSVPPRVFINSLIQKLDEIAEKVSMANTNHFNYRIPSILEGINDCRKKINILQEKINQAERIALNLKNAFQLATEKTIEMHSPLHGQHFSFSPKEKLRQSYLRSNFSNIKTAGANVWASIRDRKKAFEHIPSAHLISVQQSPQRSHENLLHNSLVHLLKSSDVELVQAIEDGQLALEGEIGNLIIQRLKDIRYSGHSSYEDKELDRHCGALPTRAAKIINRTLGADSRENPFYCDFEALYIELTKLALHAKLHPNHKKVWLGTARAVLAIIGEKTNREIGTYLNCDDSRWSWHLNRLWLQAALSLGFRLELVEQHYPKVEAALLSRDGGASFVQELLRQVRENTKATSQYNGSDAPTATTQEVLVLLDMRGIPKKGENNRIYLSQPAILDDSLRTNINISRAANPLFHSWESGSSAKAPASPLKNSSSQFFIPEDSQLLRKTHFVLGNFTKNDENQNPNTPDDSSSTLLSVLV